MIEPLAGEKQNKETKKAIQACNDYLRMGPGRSLRKLVQTYNGYSTERPPTKHLATLATWSKNFDWQSRAYTYDAEIEQQKNDLAARRRKEVLESGLALDYERIIKLNKFFEMLEKELDEIGLYYTDLKVSAKGDVVEVPTFNKALIDELRGVLDDVAKEVGGRKHKQEIELNDNTFTDEERASRIITILDKARGRRDRQVANGNGGSAR